MTPAEATAALTYANQLDPLVPLNEASADLWAHALATVTPTKPAGSSATTTKDKAQTGKDGHPSTRRSSANTPEPRSNAPQPNAPHSNAAPT